MVPWSSVFSYICHNHPDCFFDIGLLSSDINIFVDHNVRVARQNSLIYDMEHHAVPKEYNYESDAGVTLKSIKSLDGIPYVTSNSISTPVAALHFCGVESKYVLLNSNLRFLLD